MRRTASAVVLAVVGSAAVLVLLSLTWQRLQVVRAAPFSDVVVDVSGRTVAPAAFGLALVTLAGGVAALATRGLARRLVGLVVVAAGLGAGVAALYALGTPDDARARDLVAHALADRSSAGTVVPVTDGTVGVVVHAVWPVLTAVAALLTVAAGVLWTFAEQGGRRPAGLGPRYEAPVAAERPRDTTMWSALDHGDDPTLTTTDPAPTGGEHDPHTTAGGAES